MAIIFFRIFLKGRIPYHVVDSPLHLERTDLGFWYGVCLHLLFDLEVLC